jgi:hypothetical protein
MVGMGKYPRLCRGGLFVSLLSLALISLASTVACSRRVVPSSEANGQSDSRDLPFHSNADLPADMASRPGVPASGDMSRVIPFKPSASQVLPAGTLLTVRLENTLFTSRRDVGETFQAVVEEPVSIEGHIAIPRDTRVKGRVESARVSIPSRGVGYVRLTLDSILLGEKDVSLPTSSLFARGILTAPSGNATGNASRLATIRLKKGRSLTFRLTSAVDLGKKAEERAQGGTK